MRQIGLLAVASVFWASAAMANPNADGPNADDPGALTDRSGQGQSASTTDKSYGLFKTQVEGVTITRGRTLNPERTFPSKAERQATGVNLSRNYRGTTFGKHRIVREGQILYRDKLLSIQQRDDE